MVVDRNHFGAGQIDSNEEATYVALLHLLNTVIKWRNPLRLSNSKSPNHRYSELTASPPGSSKSKGHKQQSNNRVFGEEEDNEEFPQATIGYLGKLKREEAEIKLMSSPPGTFLTRWSEHTESYVVSYHDMEDGQVKHIAHLRPDPVTGSISVCTDLGVTEVFKNLHDFVDTMKKNGIITVPVEIKDYLKTGQKVDNHNYKV